MCHSIQRPNSRNIRAETPWHSTAAGLSFLIGLSMLNQMLPRPKPSWQHRFKRFPEDHVDSTLGALDDEPNAANMFKNQYQ